MDSQLAAVFQESPLLQVLWGCLVVNSSKGLGLFVLAWTASKLFRRLESELRHRIWLLVIVSSLVFPLVWLLSPQVPLSVPLAAGRSMAPPYAATLFAGRAQFLEVMNVPPMDSLIGDRWTMTLRRLLPAVAGGLWAAGAAFFLQRLLVGRLVAARLARRARPAPIERQLLAELSQTLGIKRTLAVRLCPSCGVPLTFGTRRPVVLLPEAASAWGPERLRSVLIHELTHVRRLEGLLNGIAAAICALLWFLPALWLSYSFMQLEGEKSSDRSVLRQGIRHTDYALDLVELVRASRGLILAAGGVSPLGRKRFVRDRITSVLAFHPGTSPRRLRTTGIVLAALLGALLPLLSITGASVPGEQPLVGSWVNPASVRIVRQIWTADGRVFDYYGKGTTVPSVMGRYTIEKKWLDEEGSTWYHLVTRRSPAPYRKALCKTKYTVIKIDPEGTRQEHNHSPYGYAEKLTLGEYAVLYREK